MSFFVYRFSLIHTLRLKTYTIRPVLVLLSAGEQAEKHSLSHLIQRNDVLVVLTLNQAVRLSLDGSAVKIHISTVRAAADTDSADDQGMLTALINAAARQPCCQSISVGLPKQCAAVCVKQPCGVLLSQRIQKDCFGDGGKASER